MWRSPLVQRHQVLKKRGLKKDISPDDADVEDDDELSGLSESAQKVRLMNAPFCGHASYAVVSFL